MLCSNRPKVGVCSHCHGHFPEQVKTFLPTNMGTADAMGRLFRREKEPFTVNSRAGRSQLLRWTLDLLVTVCALCPFGSRAQTGN